MRRRNREGEALTRRTFAKGAAAAVGACALGGAGAMASAGAWLSPRSARVAEGEPAERTAHTYHQSHCGGMCPLTCTVRDGRLVCVEPNDASTDERYRTICLKGISEVQHIYGKGRVQTPLKRTGERGANEFMQVSWDEALDDITRELARIQEESGKDAVLVMASSEASFPHLAPLLGARGGGFTGIDVGMGNGFDPALGFGGGYATSTADPRDWACSRMVLTVGSNFCESTLPQVRLFFEAKEAGARMVTVDPHFSTTASASDEWIPIEPGTDAALFLGMISVILEEDLLDREFAAKHTSLPFLVDTASGKLVRGAGAAEVAGAPASSATAPIEGESEGGANAAAASAQPSASFCVIDPETGQAAPYTQVDVPSLSGSVDIDGARARTVFDLMVDAWRAFGAQWASRVTDIPEEAIRALARGYAKGPSSLALGWGGNDKMTNADIAGHAAALLVALTGNVGKPGAGAGVYVGGTWSGHTATLGAWELPGRYAASSNDEIAAYDLSTRENNVRAAIFCGDMVAQRFANMSKTEDWARTLDLIVSIDAYFTEGAKWADYVLPATTRFELDSDFGNVKVGYNQIVLQEKAIDPLFEAKTELWIEREIARRMGIPPDVLPRDGTELSRAILANSPDPYISAISLEELARAGGVWPLEHASEVRREFTDLVFSTESGRMDVYYDDLVECNQALPMWEPCTEIGPQSALRAAYPLQLSNVRSRFHIHNQFNDALWIQQYFEPTIELSLGDLAARGLSTGDVARVFNGRGSFGVRVAGNPSVRPGSARLVEAATADYIAWGNMQTVTNDRATSRGRRLMQGPVIPFSDTLVEVAKAEGGSL